MNASALAVGALVCVVAFLLVCPVIPEISAGVRAVLALRMLRGAIALFGHLFLAATMVIAGARAVIATCRTPAAGPVYALALSAALGSAVVVAAVSAGYAAERQARVTGDVLCLPSLAIRADGRLALAEGGGANDLLPWPNRHGPREAIAPVRARKP
jgi:hypothetical protein